jgi:hypothetical protein
LNQVKLFVLIFIAAVFPRVCDAQVRAPLLTSDTSSFTIPFTRAGKMILVQGRVDTTVGNFILDTGSPGMVLNITYFRDYPITQNHQEQELSITGAGSEPLQTTVGTFRIGTFSYHRVEVDLLNLGHLEQSRGVKILGLLGVALFKECELVIDYANNLIHAHHIARNERNSYQHELFKDPQQYFSFPIQLKDNRVLLKTSVGSRELDLAIDLGAETSILDSRLPEKVLDSVEIQGRIILSGAGQTKVEALSGNLSGLKVGQLSIASLPVIVTNLKNTCFGGTSCINGVLGYDFASRNTIGINFVKRKLYILK